MKKISKKFRLIVLIIVMIYMIGSLILRAWLAVNGNVITYMSVAPKILFIFTAMIIPLTIFTLCMPWLIQLGQAAWLTKIRSGEAIPPTLVLFGCYGFLLSPFVFGTFLYNCGMPITQAIYFYAVGIVSTLAWGIYDLRKI